MGEGTATSRSLALLGMTAFGEGRIGVVVVANAADDMGGDKATKAVLGGLFPAISPAK